MAWLIEFISGGLCLVFVLLGGSNYFRIFVVLDMTLCTIILPSSYIVKSEKVKKVVFDRGWLKSLTDLVPSWRSNRVHTVEEMELNCPPNENVAGNHEQVIMNHLQAQQIQENLAGHIDQDDEHWWMNIDLFDDGG